MSYGRVPVDDIKHQIEVRTQDPEVQVLIGTDALKAGKHLYFVTVMVFVKPSKGGNVIFRRERITKNHSLWEKLSTETWKSLEAAMLVEHVLGGPERVEVHIDANGDERHRSSDYVKQLVGMVTGQGFRATIKPDSFVATHCADHIVRRKNTPASERRKYKKLKRRGKWED